MDLFITILAIGIAGLGFCKLGQVFLMWNELGIAIQHDTIDRKSLVPWAEKLKSKMTLWNLLAFLSLVLGLTGAYWGHYLLSTMFGTIIITTLAVSLVYICTSRYAKLYDEYQNKVGIAVDEAFLQVSGVI